MHTIFDSRGNYFPYKKNRLTFAEFKKGFVTDFNAESTRHAIFEEYRRFLTDFKKSVSSNFIQWVNGSFISNKLNPKDIDFVTLVDYQTFRKHESAIEKQFTLWGTKKYYLSIDAYTIKLFPENHKEYVLTQSDLIYWQDWFSHTQLNRAKLSFPKGYVEIHFDENTII